MRNSAALLFLTLAGAATLAAAGTAQDNGAAPAPAGAIQISQPYNKAVVRESVPVKLRDFPASGYVSISIDGRFVTAQALPKSRTQPVYVWDTKASYTDPDNPDTPKTYRDGTHAITIAVYDAQNKLVGNDSVSVQVADKINLPASQGIKLSYPWKTGLSLRYQRRTTLTASPTETPTTLQTLQQSLLRYGRTVENVSGGTSLIRDQVISVDKSVRPKAFVSYVATHGLPQALGTEVRAEYRTVDSRGQVLTKLAAQNTADSVGFSIPVLPPRRISVGAHWETPVEITLDWNSPYPAKVTATSTLEDFEWQDRYPTAKIRETYEGPATFYPGPGSALPAIASRSIKFERIYYYAYNAGRIVRTQTIISLVSSEPGLLSAASATLGGYPGGSPGGYPGGSPGGYPGGGGRGGFNRPRGGTPGGYLGGGPPGGFSGGGFPGSSPESSPDGFPGGFPGGGPPGGFPGGGFPGGMPGGYPGGGYPGGAPGGGYPGASSGSPVKLTYTEIAVLLI